MNDDRLINILGGLDLPSELEVAAAAGGEMPGACARFVSYVEELAGGRDSVSSADLEFGLELLRAGLADEGVRDDS